MAFRYVLNTLNKQIRIINYFCSFTKQPFRKRLETVKGTNFHRHMSMVDKDNISHCFTMKLETEEFHSIFSEELKSLINLFEKNGYEIRIAGGAVRDLLLDKCPDDIDFATTATPTQMKEMFTAEDIRMLNANGEAHGTITARINDKENFEVTTLRIDKVTDGRHAEVEFTTDWVLDANRRDLTVNSMFLGFDGTVYDFFNGTEDLRDRRIRFVGNPVERIKEDYLRILRYFRFYGRIAKGPSFHEPVTMDAIRENAEGLKGISGPRIWTELRKIFIGKMTFPIFKKMIELGLGEHIGFPKVNNFSELEAVCLRTEGSTFHHMTRVSAVLETTDDVYLLHKRLQISNDELAIGLFIIKHRRDDIGDDLQGYCLDLHCDNAGKEPKLIERIVELLNYWGKTEHAASFSKSDLPQFPVTGGDLFLKEVPRGPLFAMTLSNLRSIWKESRFTLSKDELLESVPKILESLPKDLPVPKEKNPKRKKKS